MKPIVVVFDLENCSFNLVNAKCVSSVQQAISWGMSWSAPPPIDSLRLPLSGFGGLIFFLQHKYPTQILLMM